MDARQKYLFDVNGYLVLDDVLSHHQCGRLIDTMKRMIDTPNDQLPEGVGHRESPCVKNLGDLTSAGPEFAELIDIPVIIDILKEIIHHELRLEITYAYIRSKGFPGLEMHGGGAFDSNGQDITLMYRHFNGHIFSGHTVVAFNLTDVSEEEGGFACIPGSHKANFPIPEDMKRFKNGKSRYLPVALRTLQGRLSDHLHRGAVPRCHPLEQRPGAHHPVLQIPPRGYEIPPLLPDPGSARKDDTQPAFLLHRGRIGSPPRARGL